ncbi:MAG TPA: hypothetical protein V6D05_15045 [Stenomitos sp.]
MVLLAAPLEDIRGLKPFLTAGPNPWAIALLAIVGAVLAGVFWYLARQAASDDEETVVAPPQAPKTIRARLDALKKLVEAGDTIRFCDHLSEILRDFLLQRYGLSSRRLTSSEVLAELERRRVPNAVHQHLESIFAACDLVKFAKVRLDRNELREHLTTAYLVLEFAGHGQIDEARNDS